MPYEVNPGGHGWVYELSFGSPVNSNVVIPLTIDPSQFGLPEVVTDAMVQEIVDLVSRSQNFVVLSAIKTKKEQQRVTPNQEPVVLPPGALDPTLPKPEDTTDPAEETTTE